MAFEPRYPIETERLRLRPFNRGDVDAVFAYRQRDDVAQHLFDGPMTHRDRHRGRAACAPGSSRSRARATRCSSPSNCARPHAMIGEVSLIWRDAANRQGEIGYIFNPVHHGQGYATEAARVLLDLGFEGLSAPSHLRPLRRRATPHRGG